MSRVPFDAEGVGTLPDEAGVYLFVDGSQKVLYVGKAASLRSRVRAYLNGTDRRTFVEYIARQAKAVEFVLTGSVKDALLLENNLIKQHAPRYNIRLRDDKTYFSLRLDLKEEWPRLTIVRRRKPDDVLYFGPYTSAQACRRTIQFLNSIFPIRTCPDTVLYNRTRPCLHYEIGRCAAPCVGLVTREEYMRSVDRIIRFLSGQDRDVLAEIEREMHRAAERLEFERAAELRDRLNNVRTTVDRPMVARSTGRERDVIGLSEAGGEAVVVVLQIRDGVLRHSDTFRLKRHVESRELLGAFLGQYYTRERTIPEEILLPAECDDLDLYREVLAERSQRGTMLQIPERGEGLRLVRLAERNAEMAAREGDQEDAAKMELLERLRGQLGLVHVPERIECYDISHFGGDEVVGSRVTFHRGVPVKSLYRHYRLRTVQRNDDFAALEEVLRRRIASGRLAGDLPDLIVIDGGRPQLRRIVDVFRELRVAEVDVIGLAKARSGERAMGELGVFERVVLPDSEEAVVLPQSGPELLLLARVRDEAHRFAIQFNRKLRRKKATTSVLELVPGLGTARARSLLRHFGSLDLVKAAGEVELAAAPGMTLRIAADLVRFFSEHRDAGAVGDSDDEVTSRGVEHGIDDPLGIE